MGSDRDFVGICWFGTQSKSSHQLGHLFKVFEVNHFDRRMHVTVGDADQCAWNAPSRPENNIRVGSAGGGDGLMLDGAFDSLGDFLQLFNDHWMIGASMSQAGAFSHADISMNGLVDRWVIGRVGDIGDQCHIRLEFVGNLSGAQAATFLHDIGYDADFCFEFFTILVNQTKGFSNGKRPHSVVEGTSDCKIVPEELEFSVNRDGIANPNQRKRLLFGSSANVDK